MILNFEMQHPFKKLKVHPITAVVTSADNFIVSCADQGAPLFYMSMVVRSKM